MPSASRRLRPGGLGALAAPGLVVCSALTTQLGSAFAVGLFSYSSPTLAAWLRNSVGAATLLGIMFAAGRSLRDLDWRAAAVLGVVLGSMNATFYEGIQRLPLGDAVSIEFIGPITVAAIFSERRRDLFFVALAALGILLVGHPGPTHLNYTGLFFILLAAVCWAVYIVLGRRVALRDRRGDTLGLAMAFSGAWLLLPAMIRSAPALSNPRVIALGLGIGLFSSALPYSLEMLAMPRVSATAFGVLLSLQPMVAALMGFVVLHQSVTASEGLGFLLVISASIGVNVSTRVQPRAEVTVTPAP
jgi:inner membrane transporter RhtA